MAQKRMFSMKIVDTDVFLDMPQSTQNLYFHLGMRADDEGFVGNIKRIMKMLGSSEDDEKVLLSKRFILEFESGVVVIKHWLINNYLQNDRIKETSYLQEKSLLYVKENGAYTFDKEQGKPLLEDKMYTKCIHRLDKISIEENRLDKIKENPKDELQEILKTYSFSEKIGIIINKWLAYKKEKGNSYKPIGFKVLLDKLKKELETRQEDEVITAIENCMAKNYQGIFFENSVNKGTQKPTSEKFNKNFNT